MSLYFSVKEVDQGFKNLISIQNEVMLEKGDERFTNFQVKLLHREGLQFSVYT